MYYMRWNMKWNFKRKLLKELQEKSWFLDIEIRYDELVFKVGRHYARER